MSHFENKDVEPIVYTKSEALVFLHYFVLFGYVLLILFTFSLFMAFAKGNLVALLIGFPLCLAGAFALRRKEAIEITDDILDTLLRQGISLKEDRNSLIKVIENSSNKKSVEIARKENDSSISRLRVIKESNNVYRITPWTKEKS